MSPQSSVIPPFSSTALRSQDVLLLVFRRVRRIRGIRIMLPFSACCSAFVSHFPASDIRRTTGTGPKISSWTYLLSGTNICLSCFECQLRVFEGSQRNISTPDNGTSETGREVEAESRISPFDTRSQYQSLRNHFCGSRRLATLHSIFLFYVVTFVSKKQEKILR